MTVRFLSKQAVMWFHEQQITEHGGATGVRDEGVLESALQRAHNKSLYEETGVFGMAAAYAFGIVRNHPFVDGNKRVGFIATAVFLRLNGHRLQAPEVEVVVMMRGLASGEITESAFAQWLEKHCL